MVCQAELGGLRETHHEETVLHVGPSKRGHEARGVHSIQPNLRGIQVK